jgi:hypothetical protein
MFRVSLQPHKQGIEEQTNMPQREKDPSQGVTGTRRKGNAVVGAPFYVHFMYIHYPTSWSDVKVEELNLVFCVW